VVINMAAAPVNSPPVVTNESAVLDEDTTAFISVLGNDTDPDGDALSAAITQGPAHGTVELADGLATYVPDANFNGSDSFNYEVTDGHGGATPGTVFISVLPVNDAPVPGPDVGATDEDTPLVLTLAGNGTDVDGDPLSATLVDGPSHGTLDLADGIATYTPAPDFFGLDDLTYELTDGQGGSATSVFHITVNPVNDRPVAADDVYGTAEDTVLAVAAPGVLSNDTDVDGDALTATLVTGPTHGQLQFTDSGAFTYTPELNYFGPDSFSYSVSDGALTADHIATVSLTVAPVDDPPLAQDDVAATSQGVAVAVEIDVLANDTDVESDALSIAGLGAAAHGTVEIVNGQVRYTPGSGFSGVDSFTYDVSDGQELDRGLVTVNVAAGNHAPSAKDDAYSLDEDTALSIGEPGVLGNDVDPDGDALTAALVTGPQHGSLTIDPTGAFVYTPVANFSGEDAFTYKASDAGGESSTASVHLTINPVNDAPVFTTTPNTSFVLDSSPTGANRDSVFQVVGNAGQAVDVHFDWALRDAAYNNEVGIFRVDDASGRIGTLRPGDDGYANAALANGHAQVIFASGKGAGAKSDFTLEGGGLYAFYLIQNDTTAHFLASNPQNRLDRGPLAFFSTATANPDGYDHMHATIQPSGAVTLAWEDLTQGGDQDFNDVVVAATNLRLPAQTPYTYAAGATDVDGDALTYRLVDGPPGATVDGTSGLLTWQPVQAGVYHFVLSAEDGKGGTAEQQFDLEVLRPQRVLFVQGTDNSDRIQISERDGLVRVVVNNEIHAYSGVDAIHVDALAADDYVQLVGLTVDTLVNGGAGNDRIDGGCVWVAHLDLRGDAGNDQLYGGAAADHLDGGSGDDQLYGGAGNDVLIGGVGNDLVKGETGDDTIVLGSGWDTLDGGPGNDPRVSEAEYAAQASSGAAPVIDWDAVAASDVSVSAGRSSWVADFVNGMALTEAERDPNSLIRIQPG
jgi:VCBS repeat-containing protein